MVTITTSILGMIPSLLYIVRICVYIYIYKSAKSYINPVRTERMALWVSSYV